MSASGRTEATGAIVSSQLGHNYADRVVGIHLTTPSTPWVWNVERPWAEVLGRVVEARSRTADRAALLEWERRRAAHIAVQTVDPQTLAYGLHDSPAALAGWLLERRRSWSDCDGDLQRAFSKDELLTAVTIYWVTETFATSARYYKEAVDVPWSPAHDRTPPVEAPTGISVFRPDSPAGSTFDWLPEVLDLRFFRDHERGGHFAPAERPEAVVADLRETFRDFR